MEKDYDNAEEIDLMECLYLIRKHIIIIVLAGLVSCFAAGSYAYMYVPVTYTSSTSILVLSKETIVTSIEDLEFGTQLVNDYQALITSKAVLAQVIEEMNLSMSTDLLKSCIQVENPENTRLLYLYVTCGDPQLAKDIVDKLTEVSALYVADKI